MLSLESFAWFIVYFVLAPVMGVMTLLFLFVFEKRIDLLESKNKKIQLEKELQQAKYYQLNQQIQPHFLFNVLNIILSLARLQRTEQLVRALEHFSLFLKFRYKTNEPLIFVREEIEYTKHYLEIQKLRYDSRLSVNVEYEEELLDAYIPPFILQTLVENAFKHGLETKTGEALLQIRFLLEGEQIVLQVIDNGSAEQSWSGEAQEKSGYGLDNIRHRLFLYFGERASLSMNSAQGQGAKVEVKWPLVVCPP